MRLFLIFLFLFLGIKTHCSWLFFLFAFLLILIGFIKKKKSLKWVICLSSIFILGYSISFIKPSFNKKIYSGFVIDSKTNYFIFSSSLERLYVYNKDNQLEIGDYIEINGFKRELSFSNIESSFDFNKYLNNKGVYNQLVAEKIIVKFSTPFRVNHTKEKFLNNFSSETKEFLSEFLFGKNEDSPTMSVLKQLHVHKILSISGFYIYFLFNLFTYLFSIFFKKKKAKLFALFSLSIFLIFNLNRFSTIRIFSLLLFSYINEFLLKKRFNRLELLSGLAIFFLLIDYNLAFQDSFIIGFFVSFYLILVNKFKNRIKNKIGKYIISYLFLFLFFIPIELKFYNEINVLSFLSEIALSIFIFPLFTLSILSFFKIPLYSLTNNYFSFFKNISSFIGKIKISIYGDSFSLFFLFIYYLILILILYLLLIRHKPLVNKVTNVLLFSLTLYFFPFNNYSSMEVSFINVGQGDATLIRYKNEVALIDTGGLKSIDIATSSLIPFFKRKQIYDIDLLITTHDDFDHSGGKDSLIKNFKVKKYVKTSNAFPIKFANTYFINLNKWINVNNDENDNSLVIYFTFMDMRFLIMGDASYKIEEKIINDNESLPVDVLKVSHHGSSSATSKDFIKFISPKVAIISVGKNNNYGHPNKNVLATLRKENVIIKRTDIDGTITFYKSFLFKNKKTI